jgi:hypothetical protein
VAGYGVVDSLDGNTRSYALGKGSGSWDGGGVLFLDYDFVAVCVVVVRAGVGVRRRVVVAGTVDGVEDFIGGFVETLAERMILAVVVVISHITLVLLGGVDGGSGSLLYSNFSSGLRRVARVDSVNLTP